MFPHILLAVHFCLLASTFVLCFYQWRELISPWKMSHKQWRPKSSMKTETFSPGMWVNTGCINFTKGTFILSCLSWLCNRLFFFFFCLKFELWDQTSWFFLCHWKTETPGSWHHVHSCYACHYIYDITDLVQSVALKDIFSWLSNADFEQTRPQKNWVYFLFYSYWKDLQCFSAYGPC